MKRFLFFLIIIVLLSLPLPVSAQLKSVLVPGVNCGVANDISKSRCCTPTVTTVSSFLPDLGQPFNTLRDLVMGPGLLIVKKSTQPWLDYQKSLSVPCQLGRQSTDDASDPSCRCITDPSVLPTPGLLDSLKGYCAKLKNDKERPVCLNCISAGGVWTGIGCVYGDLKRFIGETVFGVGVGLAGGISLLCIIYAAFIMQTSGGSPEKLKKAQELLTACIMGLILIIFSVFILRLIGVDILRIPGFS